MTIKELKAFLAEQEAKAEESHRRTMKNHREIMEMIDRVQNRKRPHKSGNSNEGR